MKKRDVFTKIKERYDECDLDEHVHEIKFEQASEINNQGMDAQLEFLAEQCGVDWLEQMFLEE